MTSPNRIEGKETLVVTCCWPGRGPAIFWGSVLVVFGALGLLSLLVPAAHLGRYLVPVFLLVWGVYLLLGQRARRSGA